VVVSGDTNHLRQAIDNLVTNALRHTRTGTPIEVAARLDGNGDGDGDDGEPRAVITVRDHGDGLNDVGLRHAFDRFWQASPSRSSVGAGLGLAIVAAIAAEHDGTASVANAPDGGAVFALKLPVGNRG
jgi:signal transduction histidine kinase